MTQPTDKHGYDYTQGDDEGDETYKLRLVDRATQLERELAIATEHVERGEAAVAALSAEGRIRSLIEHPETSQCGFDRNASHSENTYVCNCGWRDEGMTEAQKAAYWFDLYLEETTKRRALEAKSSSIEAPELKHLQDAPLTLRNSFEVQDPNDPKKMVRVVYASFAVQLERAKNQALSSTGIALLSDDEAMAKVNALCERTDPRLLVSVLKGELWAAWTGADSKARSAIVPQSELLSVLRELADLMDDTVSGNYKPDGFTTQPARSLLRIADGRADD